MILDQDGNPVDQPTRHRFGHFIVPDNTRVCGFGGITATSRDTKNPEDWYRAHSEHRCQHELGGETK